MKKLLVVVDMQNDFVDGSLGTKEAQAIVGAVIKKAAEEKRKGADIIFTRDTHEENYLETQEGRKLPVEHCIRGTKGWEIIDGLMPLAEQIIDKPTFGSVKLAHLVAEKQYEEIELVGLCTDICVVSNALLIKACLPEAVVKVDSTCCAGVTPESHAAALQTMAMCQIEVR
ncbi:MAG TPA: amidase [Lachnospiraceae bacterium]|nr:amidase [Lachnospiraceae bacterium]